MDEDKLVLDTVEIVYRHYLQCGTERKQLEEPLVIKHSAIMYDREFPIYAVNEMLDKLRRAIIERIDRG